MWIVKPGTVALYGFLSITLQDSLAEHRNWAQNQKQSGMGRCWSCIERCDSIKVLRFVICFMAHFLPAPTAQRANAAKKSWYVNTPPQPEKFSFFCAGVMLQRVTKRFSLDIQIQRCFIVQKSWIKYIGKFIQANVTKMHTVRLSSDTYWKIAHSHNTRNSSTVHWPSEIEN